MVISIVAFTEKGAFLGSKILGVLASLGHEVRAFNKNGSAGLEILKSDIYEFASENFKQNQALIFIGATGIAIRAISPLVKGKDVDPAVIVIDDLGKFVISILSGHLGGANDMAKLIASKIDAIPVITTATDLSNVLAIDNWAKDRELVIQNIDAIKKISATLLAGDKISFYCKYPVCGKIPDEFTSQDDSIGVMIGDAQTISPFKTTLRLYPKQYIVGVGCRKNIDFNHLNEKFIEVMEQNKLLISQVLAIASIDIKKEEKAILSLCQNYNLPFYTYSKEELEALSGDFQKSEFVKETTGVDNVCERSAIKASGNNELIVGKTKCSGITFAIAKKEWRCEF